MKTRTIVITAKAKYVNGDVPMESISRYIATAQEQIRSAMTQNFGPNVELESEVMLHDPKVLHVKK